jgi:hypothetical protein
LTCGWAEAEPGQARLQPEDPHAQRPAGLPGRPVDPEPPGGDRLAPDGRVGPRDAERLDLRVVHARGRERGEFVEVVKGGPAQLQPWRMQPEAANGQCGDVMKAIVSAPPARRNA